jgi:glycopeptide antibiotics resistance protein
MSELLVLFYRLPEPLIGQVFLLLSFAFCLLWRTHGQQPWFRRSCWLFLTAWAAVTLYTTVLARFPMDQRMVSLIPFRFFWEPLMGGSFELRRAAFMNVALFYPAGLLTAALLPRHWSGGRRLALTAGLFLGFSGLIECSQYLWVLGEVEVDDLLCNTLGAALGAWPILWEEPLFGPK